MPKLQYLEQSMNTVELLKSKVSAPDDELSLQSHMLVPDIVGASRSYRNWYSANYRKFTIRKSSTAKIRGQH